MAKVKGGLFSEHASGMLGGLVLFGAAKVGQTVRRHKKTSARPSSAQISQREKFASARDKWKTATTEQKAEAQALAEKLHISTYSAFIKLFINVTQPVGLTTWNNGATVWNSGETIWNRA